MGADIRAPVLGRFHRGPQFGFGEGGRIKRSERRRDAAAGGQLDLRRALHELLAHAQAHLVRAVGDHGSAKLLDAAEHSADGARQIGEVAEVAVTGGHRDDRAGRIDARPRHVPSSMARLSEKAGPPMSRTVVNPRISVAVASALARSVV